MPSREEIPQFKTLEEEKAYWESKGSLGIEAQREEILVKYRGVKYKCHLCDERRYGGFEATNSGKRWTCDICYVEVLDAN